MNISATAKKRITELLPAGSAGFSVTGFVGTCRGSTPVLHPAKETQPGQKTILCEGLTFFVNPELADDFRECLIDYDGSFLGKGLTVIWPHREGCACHS
jgi:Fe-S cluster assembly iron-binding protein IscA